MNKHLPGILISIVLCFFAYAFPQAHVFATPYLQFNPTTIESVLNNTFQVDVRINVDSNTILASDAIINYAGTDLEVISVTNGGFFEDRQFSFAPTAPSSNGTLEIHGFTTDPTSNITGSGSFAKIIFKAKKGSGSSAITFTCAAGTNNTNILTTTGTNLLTSCTQVNQISVNYTGDIIPTVATTTVPTQPPGSSPTTTPTPTQGSGNNTVPYCASVSTDITVVTGVPKTITVSCSGVDPDGYINGAEFWFGDGSSQIVTKNVGSPGTVTTSHTYTKAGLYTLQCKVKDNNQVFSRLPEVCKKILTIQKPAGTTTAKKIAVLPKTSPTPIIVTLIEETPDPTPLPEITAIPEETMENEQPSNPFRFLWILVGIIPAFIIIKLFKKGQRNPPIPPIQAPTTDSPQYPEPKF